ncbi:MAG: hypothetical protein AAF743_18000 [Planctomycetota bacterium]
MPLITDRVTTANAGTNPTVITRMPSGWAVLGDVQSFPGWSLLLPDPVVPSLNDLPEPARTAFLADMAKLGDAVLAVTGAIRINYAIFGNLEPELHAHVVPRKADEPESYRTKPPFSNPEQRPFDADRDAELIAAIRQHLVGP